MDNILWNAKNVLVAPAGSLDFEPLGEIKTVNTIATENSGDGLYPVDNTLTFDVQVPEMSEDLLKVFGINLRKRLPRKTKKAIKKQCPGITPREIQQILQVGKVRRIKHRRR